MDDHLYRFMVTTALVLTVAWVGWSLYAGFLRDAGPGDYAYLAGNRFFEDGNFERALEQYERAMQEYRESLAEPTGLFADHPEPMPPEHIHALRGKANTLLQLNRYLESLAAFDLAIRIEPEFPGTYANRGILYDHMGEYEKALADYEHALRLNPRVATGPSWLTRFLRLQPEKPPTIADRAAYLQKQLAKPAGERLLRVPELDDQQRPYAM